MSEAGAPAGPARLAGKLAAFRAGLTPEERALFDGTVGARLDPDAIWPPGAPLRPDPAPPPMIVYTVPGCAGCEALGAFLARRGVPAVVRDVTRDREAARELVRVRRGVPGAVGAFPLVVVGDTVVLGFDAVRLRDLLRSPAVAPDPV